MAKKRIRFMNTAFRDGFQSVYGARVFTDDFIPAVEACAAAGIRHYEAGGGARFQSLYFYCNEDAFAMMDRFRAAAGPDADLQTLARGINVVALDSQPREIIKLHADLFAGHGITSIRNFDALNDIDNLRYSGRCIADAGLRHQVAVTMMALPPGCTGAHDPDFYAMILRRLLDAEIPFHSVSFKDASGTSTPATVYETIRRARTMLPADTTINFHTHDTAGIAVICYRAALDAGADTIDLSMAPCSGGTCQPDIATMWHALRGTDYDLDVDIDKVMEAEEVFKECMRDYFVLPEAKAVEPMIPWAPMPGGALTANTQMMRDIGSLNRYPEVIAGLGEVVRRGGFGTSVTPVSQFYFQQAFNNVMLGEWKKIAAGYGKMVLGYFGKTPIPPDPEIVRIASAQLGLAPLAEDPLNIIEMDQDKGITAARHKLEANHLDVTDESIFIAAICGEKGINFLRGKGTIGVRKKPAAKDGAGANEASDRAGGYTVKLNGRTYAVKLDGDTAVVNGRTYRIDVTEGIQKTAASGEAGAPKRRTLRAPMPGMIVRLKVAAGDAVKTGDTLLFLESMKMEVALTAPIDGTIAAVSVAAGDQVKSEQELLSIR